MRIKEFLKLSLTSQLGNMLAAANLMMVFGREAGAAYLNHKFIFDLNRPAYLLLQMLWGYFPPPFATLLLVYFQWILIGGIAKALAARSQPPVFD